MHDRSYFTDLTDAIGSGWNRFWFTPVDPLPCGVVRIVTGAIVTAHLLSLVPDLGRWYARDGLLPPGAVSKLLALFSGGDASNYHFSYLSVFPAGTELWVVHAAAIAVALSFMLGLFTRLSGALTLVAVLAYVHRVPFVAGDLEPVLAYLLAYLVIAPAGACLSIDRWLQRRRTSNAEADSPSPSVTANIALRLIQVHTAMFVAMMGFSKLYGDAWWGGGAIWLLLTQTESRPLDLTGLRGAGQLGEYLLNFWAHAIIYIELTFPILVWNRLARPLVLMFAAAAWLSLALATGSLLLALALIAASASFVPAEFYRRRTGQPALLPSSA
jgi:hypothetical protein